MSGFKSITSQDQFDNLITARIKRERKRICTQMISELKKIYSIESRADMQMQMVKLIDKLNNLQGTWNGTDSKSI